MKETTSDLQEELEEIIQWFESDDFDIDKATDKYERGQELIKELQKRLKDTKNKIKKLNVNLD